MARKPYICANAHNGCKCGGSTIAHNLFAQKRMLDTIREAQTDSCPKCGGAASAELVAIWGHCMQCQKASQAATYGNFGR